MNVRTNTDRIPASFVGESAAAYWFSDGMPELAFGLVMAMMGATGYAWVVYFPYRWMQVNFGITMICFFGPFLGRRRILGAVKSRTTYRRTGYAQPPAIGRADRDYVLTLLTGNLSSANKNVTAFAMDAVYAFFSASMLLRLMNYRWSVSVVMFAIACFVYFGRRWSEYPYSWWSVVPLAVARIPFSVANLSAHGRDLVPIMIGGLWLFCRGVWTMARYLRMNPRSRLDLSVHAYR